VHHEPEHLYSLNSSRVHPFEVLWGHSVDMAPLIILGCGLEAMTLWTIFHGVIIFCAHANVDFRTGFLAWIVNTPELHRWHHSKNLQEANSNYSGNLVLWDIVFGTRRLPKRGAAEVGRPVDRSVPAPACRERGHTFAGPGSPFMLGRRPPCRPAPRPGVRRRTTRQWETNRVI